MGKREIACCRLIQSSGLKTMTGTAAHAEHVITRWYNRDTSVREAPNEKFHYQFRTSRPPLNDNLERYDFCTKRQGMIMQTTMCRPPCGVKVNSVQNDFEYILTNEWICIYVITHKVKRHINWYDRIPRREIRFQPAIRIVWQWDVCTQKTQSEPWQLESTHQCQDDIEWSFPSPIYKAARKSFLQAQVVQVLWRTAPCCVVVRY